MRRPTASKVFWAIRGGRNVAVVSPARTRRPMVRAWVLEAMTVFLFFRDQCRGRIRVRSHSAASRENITIPAQRLNPVS